jgi:hypothetical protein
MDRELNAGFPTLAKAKNGRAAAALTLLRDMPDPSRRVSTCIGLLQSRHSAALKLLGEQIEAEAKSAESQFAAERFTGRGKRIMVEYERARAKEGGRNLPADMTPAKLDPLARASFDEYMSQQAGAPAEADPGRIEWDYRRQYGDWNSLTRVDIHSGGIGGVEISYWHFMNRADYGPGALGEAIHELGPPAWTLLDLIGLRVESWTVYSEEQAEEALRLIREMWDVYFAKIPRLLKDLTIE